VLAASDFFTMPVDTITAAHEARFFGGLKTGNDTFKRTEPGRLGAIDTAVARRIGAEGGRLREVLDLGISSGVTTLELRAALQAAGHDVSITGTDRLLRADLVDLPWGCRALVEPEGHVLQYEVMGRSLRPWRRRLDYVTGMAAVRWSADRLLGGVISERRRRKRFTHPVMLVSPRLSSAPAVSLIEDDITVSNPRLRGRFQFIRAANLLNIHYFTPEALRRAIDNVLSYLDGTGAWLLVVRTHGMDDHRGTLFRVRADGTLMAYERYGSGSEIERLLLEGD
jgi:hypothetical protein